MHGERAARIAGFEDMRAQAVDAIDKARADAAGQNSGIERRENEHGQLRARAIRRG